MPKLALQPLYSPDVATLAPDRLIDQLAPRFDRPSVRLTPSPALTEQQVMKRWQKLAAPEAQALLLDEQTERTMQAYQKKHRVFHRHSETACRYCGATAR